MTDRKPDKLTDTLRLTARILIVIWGAVIVFGGLLTLPETGPDSSVFLFHIIIPLFSVVIAMYWEGIGGILQIAYGFFGWFLVIYVDTTIWGNMLFVSPIFIGVLLITCWFRSLDKTNKAQ